MDQTQASTPLCCATGELRNSGFYALVNLFCVSVLTHWRVKKLIRYAFSECFCFTTMFH